MKNRRKFTAAFKAKVALEAIRERESLSALSSRYELKQEQIFSTVLKLIWMILLEATTTDRCIYLFVPYSNFPNFPFKKDLF